MKESQWLLAEYRQGESNKPARLLSVFILPDGEMDFSPFRDTVIKSLQTSTWYTGEVVDQVFMEGAYSWNSRRSECMYYIEARRVVPKQPTALEVGEWAGLAKMAAACSFDKAVAEWHRRPFPGTDDVAPPLIDFLGMTEEDYESLFHSDRNIEGVINSYREADESLDDLGDGRWKRDFRKAD